MAGRADKISRPTPKQRALAWWKGRVDTGRYVVSTAEAPSAGVAKVIRQERLALDVANKRVWILTQPDRTDERGIFLRNYWAVVDLVTQGWAPAAVEGVAAVRLHLGEAAPPVTLPVQHGANQSRYTLDLFDEFTVHLRPGTVSVDRIVRLATPNGETNVIGAADLLTTLDVQELEAGIEPVSAWLRHLVIKTSDLEAALADRPRPVVLTRLATLARELGNRGLAQQIDAAIRGITEYPPSLSATGIGARIHLPKALATVPRGTGSPWVDRQLMTLERFRGELTPLLSTRVEPPPRLTLRTLIGNARQAKQYDAYHNTTMEGYHISREVSDAIVSGTALPVARTAEELRAIMAVQGYSTAFDLVIDRVRTVPPLSLGEDLILDLYVALFRPSVDAGIVGEQDLRGWRTTNVGLAGGWRHVPPNHRKVLDLIRGMSEYLMRADLEPLTRAVLAHLELVTIHPFIDGNGRLARLLMNYALLAAGYPWVTIRTDERLPYFRALESAQVGEDVRPLGEFLALHIAQAVSAIRNNPKSDAS
jgi:Fic/DOC family